VSAAADTPWQATPDGIVLAVRVTPKGGRDAIEGVVRMADGQRVIKARVRAPASEGEANAALLRLFASSLDVAPRQVSLVAGASARTKRIKVAGAVGALTAALARVLAAGCS
jgi:hypothetical protein